MKPDGDPRRGQKLCSRYETDAGGQLEKRQRIGEGGAAPRRQEIVGGHDVHEARYVQRLAGAGGNQNESNEPAWDLFHHGGLQSEALLLWIGREDLSSARLVECDHFIGFDATSWNFHTGRSDGHSGHRNPCDIGPFGNKTPDFLYGNMAFDDIAIHDGRVARLEVSRNLVPGFHRTEITDVPGVHLDTVPLEIVTPCATAASKRRFEDCCLEKFRVICLNLRIRCAIGQGRQKHRQQKTTHTVLLCRIVLREYCTREFGAI